MKTEHIAAQCRHYAMCKIDYLGTGICPAARANPYVSFFPQGRMDIYSALVRGTLAVTPALVDIAESCDLCGICDKQCYFTTQLRPGRVMAALKDHVASWLDTRSPEPVPADRVLRVLQSITGDAWASNDPAHQVAYATDPSPVSVETRPGYVVLPASTDEVRQIMDLCRKENLAWAVRGNGSSVMGFVFSTGVVLDLARMKWMDFDESNWSVRTGAGISAFELQKAAAQKGYRVNAAEPAAMYCANIMCSGIFSLFSSTYGTGADNIIDAQFVTPEGDVFWLSDPDAPRADTFIRKDRPLTGICTQARVRLHPVMDDESGIAVPFDTMTAALVYARDLNMRGIGIGIGVLGSEYLSTFLAPTRELAQKARTVFFDHLEMAALVVVLGDRFALDAARRLAPAVIEAPVLKALILGMPSLVDDALPELMAGISGHGRPYERLTRPEFLPVLEAILDPSPANLASAVDDDLKPFYEQLYSRPEMSDILWLNTFRIISARMGRDGHVEAFILYVPLDNLDQIIEIDWAFSKVAEKNGVRGDFGFVTPMDRGRFALLEWDMYLDHTDNAQIQHMQSAMADVGHLIADLEQQDPRILWIRYVFNQGWSRKESWFYHGATGNRS